MEFRDDIAILNIYPNLRAEIVYDLEPRKIVESSRDPPQYMASLFLHEPISIATLSSILRYPLEWQSSGKYGSRSCIRGIDDVMFGSNACLIRGHCHDDDIFQPTEGTLSTATVGFRNHGKAITPRDSIRRLSHFVLPCRGPASGLDRLLIHIDKLATLDHWIEHVSDLQSRPTRKLTLLGHEASSIPQTQTRCLSIFSYRHWPRHVRAGVHGYRYTVLASL